MNRRRFLSLLGAAALAMRAELPPLRFDCLRELPPERPSTEFLEFVKIIQVDIAAGIGIPYNLIAWKA